MSVPGLVSDAPSPTSPSGFAGFGEDAPLSVPDTPAVQAGIMRRLVDGTTEEFADALAGVGNCAHPVRLIGSSTTVDTDTGEVLASFSSADAPLGVLHVPCGNRRAHICPACSRTYARDTFEVIRAGALGGKTVPATVADSPLLFVTLTAPSFGLVHRVATDKNGDVVPCRPRRSDTARVCPHGVPMSCHRRHGEDDPEVGGPLCPDCYDWTGAVIWQWHAPELWRRTTITMRRELARLLGVSESRFRKEYGSVQFAKVAEYQRRGMVHFHALIRLDGLDGPGSPAPLTSEKMAAAVRAAIRSTTVTAPPAWETDDERVIAWGAQCDIQTITTTGTATQGELTASQVAGYVAKYASKDANDSADGRMRPHHARMRATCHDLHDLAAHRAQMRRAGQTSVVPLDKNGADHYALIGKWAHMLGFRGHFSTRSRRYSVTLGALRRARRRWQTLAAESHRTGVPLDTRDLERRLLAEDEEETTLIVGAWSYAGTGWRTEADKALALAVAARDREYAQWKATNKPPTHR